MRARFTGATLEVLYDPDTMPPALRKAHEVLDRAVDRLYRRAPFRFERERVEHMFGLFETAAVPLAPQGKPLRAARARGTAA